MSKKKKKKLEAAKAPEEPTPKLPRGVYEAELQRLQEELVVLADWVKREGARVLVVFEGRDAAGKGGVIKRITEYMPPRVVRTVALPAPTEREKSEWYFQRYAAHLPAGGEMVLFDRSWYNRAGVERVMGFCTDREHALFLRQAPVFERMLREDGIIVLKYWFSVSDEEQEKRFRKRLEDPLKQWKLSPMDLESRRRWEDYTKAKEEMLARTHIPEARWWVVEGNDKRRARLNCIHHLLQQVPYSDVAHQPITLPQRDHKPDYARTPVPPELHVPAVY